MKGNLFSVRDFDERLTERFKQIYQEKEKTLKMFSNSDFYDIKLENPCLSSEMNRLICDYITSSASTDFNIFLEFICREQRPSRIPDNLYFFTLKKLVNNFEFGIKYKNESTETLPYKQKQFFLHEKHFKYLLNCLFNVTLIFRKFYPDLNVITNYSYKYSTANYRFMIFDSGFPFRNIIGYPDKELTVYCSYCDGQFKPVISTKLKLSGKLPESFSTQNVNSILKKKFKMFSPLKEEYKIEAFWRFEDNAVKSENEEKSNSNYKTYCLKILSTNHIKELVNFKLKINFKLLSIKDYSILFEFTSKGSIELPGFTREIKMYLGWRKKPHNIKFYFQQQDINKKIYAIDSSLFYHKENFRIFSDNNLNITNIVDNLHKFKFRGQAEVTVGDYESNIENLLAALHFRL